MKKRTKKALSFGVAALMAVSSLPFSALSVTASTGEGQSANGGTDYNFVLKEEGTGVQEIQISKDDVAAGAVTKKLGVYIESEEWASDNYPKFITLNWTATTGKTLADGGAVNNKIFYQNTLNVEEPDAVASDKVLPNGSVINTNQQVFCLSPLLDLGDGTYLYSGANCTSTIREVACDAVFGSDLMYTGKDQLSFVYWYYENYEDYTVDAEGFKNDSKYKAQKQKVKEEVCTVQYEDGVPYFEYTYITQGASDPNGYVEKTAKQYLPCFSNDRTVSKKVKQADGKNVMKDCVPDVNNYFNWGTKSSSQVKWALGDSDALPLTTFEVVIPQGTEEGTYYVQLSSKNADKEVIPLQTAADYATVKADQDAKRAAGRLEDLSTAINSNSKTDPYCLPQSAEPAVVKIVVGDGTAQTTAESTTTSEETTTQQVVTGDKTVWTIADDVFVEPGKKIASIPIYVENGVATAGMSGAMVLPDCTKKVMGLFEGSPLTPEMVFAGGDAYAISPTGNAENYEKGKLYFTFAGQDPVEQVGNTLLKMNWSIADEATVKAAAAEAKLPLKTDADGKTYYAFPIQWMEDGVDIGISKGQEVEIKRFDYRDEMENDIHETNLELVDGAINIYVEETPIEKTVWKIADDVFTEPGKTVVSVPIYVENGVASAGMSGAMVLPDCTKKVMGLFEGSPLTPETVFQGGDAYAISPTGNAENYEKGKLYFTFAGQDPVEQVGNTLLKMNWSIADEATVKAAAAEAGLELKTDADGKTYYAFPIQWMEDGVDIGISKGQEVEIKRFDYRDEMENDIHETNLELVDGAINIYVTAEEETTTAEETTTTTEETTTTTTTTTEEETTTTTTTTSTTAESTTTSTTTTTAKPIEGTAVWQLDKVEMKPLDGNDGKGYLYNVKATAGIDEALGMRMAIQLPDATKELLQFPLHYANEEGVFDVVLGDMYPQFTITPNLKTIKTDGKAFVAMASNDPTSLAAASGTLISLKISIPDEATVKEIAEKYSIELVQDGDKYYYEFPVNWMEKGTDIQISNNQEVENKRFEYVNSGNEDIFEEYVTLENGYIRVLVSKPEETTTAAETTTEAEETTTAAETTTTAAETTTTAAETTTTAAETTTTEETPVVPTVEVKESVAFYFSHDDTTFASMAKDLLTVKVGDTDVTDKVTFSFESPADAWDKSSKDSGFVKVDMTASYEGTELEDSTITLYIGVKGDENLNGEVEMTDAYWTLLYNSYHSAGDKNYKFTTSDDVLKAKAKGDEANIEKLVYFLCDVDTESKAGVDSDAGKIEMVDAYHILLFTSYKSAGGAKPWSWILEN